MDHKTSLPRLIVLMSNNTRFSDCGNSLNIKGNCLGNQLDFMQWVGVRTCQKCELDMCANVNGVTDGFINNEFVMSVQMISLYSVIVWLGTITIFLMEIHVYK